MSKDSIGTKSISNGNETNGNKNEILMTLKHLSKVLFSAERGGGGGDK